MKMVMYVSVVSIGGKGVNNPSLKWIVNKQETHNRGVFCLDDDG